MRPQVVELAPHPDGSHARRQEDGAEEAAATSPSSASRGRSTSPARATWRGRSSSRVAEQPELRHLLIAGNGISELDASGEETLRHLVENLREAGYTVSFSGVSDKVLDVLKRAHAARRIIGEEHFYGTRAQAIAAIYGDAHARSEETDCPYHAAMPPIDRAVAAR